MFVFLRVLKLLLVETVLKKETQFIFGDSLQYHERDDN